MASYGISILVFLHQKKRLLNKQMSHPALKLELKLLLQGQTPPPTGFSTFIHYTYRLLHYG